MMHSDQAAATPAAFRFLRPAISPITPRPPTKSGRAAGSGAAAAVFSSTSWMMALPPLACTL